MIREGVPQSVAMRVSGHRTSAMFTRYDITSEADKVEALLKTQAHIYAQAAKTSKVATGDFTRASE